MGRAPAGRRSGGGCPRHDRHRDGARPPHRPARTLQPGNQPRRSRDAACDGRVRLLPSTIRRLIRARRSGTRWRAPRATISRGRAGGRNRLVPRARFPAQALFRDGMVPLPDPQGAGAPVRASLPGADQAPRRRARPPSPRDGDRVVGPPASRVRAAAVLRAVPGDLDQLRARGGARPGRVPVLGSHQPQHAVFVGRERGHPAHQRGRRQCGRASRGAHEPRRPRAGSASATGTRWSSSRWSARRGGGRCSGKGCGRTRWS